MTQSYIGTSGWQFPELTQKKKAAEQPGSNLEYYSMLFNSVENNSAFYHVPRISTLQKWFMETPDDFVFSFKLNKRFTHEHKLVLDQKLLLELQEFFTNLQEMKYKLGAVLVQLPPSLKYDQELLTKFLKQCQSITKNQDVQPDLAFEFRNESWFQENTYKVLRKYNAALVVSQSPKYPLSKTITADFTYLRFHGPEELFRSTYSDKSLKEWKTYIRTLKDLRKIYIYFNNTLSSQVIENANYVT